MRCPKVSQRRWRSGPSARPRRSRLRAAPERRGLAQCLAGFEHDPWHGWLLDDIESLVGEVARRARTSDVLSHPPFDPDEANHAIVRRPTGVRRARAGDVLLMKGRLGGGDGLVHRSPPIEELGLMRVVLVVSA